jgi:hypothetical protein
MIPGISTSLYSLPPVLRDQFRNFRLPCLRILFLDGAHPRHEFLESYMTGIQLGLQLRRVATGASLQHFQVFADDLELVFLDVLDGGLDLPGANPKEGGNAVWGPAFQQVVQQSVHRNPSPRDLRSPAAVNDGLLIGFHT